MKYLAIILCVVGFARADEFQRHEDAQDQVAATQGVAYEIRQQGQSHGGDLTVSMNGEDCQFSPLMAKGKSETLVTKDDRRHTLWVLKCPSDPEEK